jgi:hypothetical protein
MTPRRTQSVPALRGVPDQAAEEVRVMARTIQRLEARIRTLEGAGYMTTRQAEARYSPPIMAQELSATGSAPLNVVTVGGQNIIQAQPGARRR